jgi:hypothetical protein
MTRNAGRRRRGIARWFLSFLAGAALALALGCAPHRGSRLEMISPRVSKLGLLGVRPQSTFFTNLATGEPVVLSGSHTWNNFQDWGRDDPPRTLDYVGYLNFLERHGHNFIRLYRWEQAAWFPGTPTEVRVTPLAYQRTGPGVAKDGKPRFDLTRFNEAFFRRMRKRVELAGERGIYVSVMLFDGWSLERKGRRRGANPWDGHPFNKENNINGIDGDVDHDGQGAEIHTLENPSVTALQKAYIAKVIATVGDLDNVLFEISNESRKESIDWHYEMIRTVQSLERAGGGKLHPVGFTAPYPISELGNKPLWNSPADWISPIDEVGERYKSDPPVPGRGGKVVISDTDHLWGIGGDPDWVWKSFLRGVNPIFMDPYDTAIRKKLPVWPTWANSVFHGDPSPNAPRPCWDQVRTAMGYVLAMAHRVDLAAMRPMGELASSRYCMADPGREYLAYLPGSGRMQTFSRWIRSGRPGERVLLDLGAGQGAMDVEWVDVARGWIVPGERVEGGRRVELVAPFAGSALLHVRASNGNLMARHAPAGPVPRK